MRRKTTFLKVSIGLALAVIIQSCSIVKNGDFSQQKYTKFRKGTEIAITKKVTVNEVVPQELSAVSAVSANPMETNSKSLLASVNQNQTIPVAFTKNSKQSKTNSVAVNIVNRSVAKFSKRLSNTFASHNSMVSASDDQLLLILLAIFIPPLAVYLSAGLGTEFWIDLLLTCLFWLPGVIYAFIVILR
jgi:uncharacterized membrane protein YqaE (UPF0057 family)